MDGMSGWQSDIYDEYRAQTGSNPFNSQGEPDIDFVLWLGEAYFDKRAEACSAACSNIACVLTQCQDRPERQYFLPNDM